MEGFAKDFSFVLSLMGVLFFVSSDCSRIYPYLCRRIKRRIMESKKIGLSALSLNANNPRTITDDAFQRLVTSVLVFPKMLALRPIVVDGVGVALGGNMRLRALLAVAALSIDEIEARLLGCDEYVEKLPAERDVLLGYWRAWLECPTAEVVLGDELSDDEMRAFVIKDNVMFGAWDVSALNDDWDARLLEGWGVEISDEGDEVEDAESDRVNMTLKFSAEEHAFVFECLSQVCVEDADKLGNENRNGNALYALVRQWADGKDRAV